MNHTLASTGDPSAPAITDVIDASPIGGFQIRLLVLLALAILFDGFDVQAMGFVAPSIIAEWHLQPSMLGPIFAAGLLGMLIGSVVLGIASDRYGRRPVLIASLIAFGLCMLATASAQSLVALGAWRFLTGLGLGGVMGNAIALASEYSPRRRRASILMILSCGFTGGAILGGLVSAVVIPVASWHAVFLLGGAFPILLGLVMIAILPESPQFTLAKGRGQEAVAKLMAKIAPAHAHASFRSEAPAQASGGLRGLFIEARAPLTALLWAVSFCNMLNLFLLASWLPTLAVRMGFDQRSAVLLGTTLQIGGVAGAVLLGPLIDRFGFQRVLIVALAIAAVSIAAIGQPGTTLVVLGGFVLFAGIGVLGAQPAINAIAAMIYPPDVRGSGIGWILGVGRAGAITGPLLTGVLLERGWSPTELFYVASIPALLSAAVIFVLGRMMAGRG